MDTNLELTQAHYPNSIAIVAPAPPPFGGMALQGQALRDNLQREGLGAVVVATNPALPLFLSKIKGLRTLLQTVAYTVQLLGVIPRAKIVHVLAASYFYFFSRVTPAILISRLFGRRVIVNYRGGEAGRFFEGFGWAVRPILKCANAITVPSAFLERCLRGHGLAAQIVPNLVDLDRFKFRERKLLRPCLLVSRNLEPMYNVLMALRAFEMIKSLHADAQIEVIGSGSQEEALKAWVREKGLRDVFFRGAVPNEEMPGYLDRADIFLNPSNVDNLPISLLEAFASGVPVVSTDAGGIPDLVNSERAALLVRAGDYREMAVKVAELLAEPDLATPMVGRARRLAESFSWRRVREKLLAVYFPKEKFAAAVGLAGGK